MNAEKDSGIETILIVRDSVPPLEVKRRKVFEAAPAEKKEISDAKEGNRNSYMQCLDHAAEGPGSQALPSEKEFAH